MKTENTEKILTKIRDATQRDKGVIVILCSREDDSFIFVDKFTSIEVLGFLEFEVQRFYERMKNNVLEENKKQ